jgi:2-C-methyl-D-erythritol 4-phosphate cytidylyltransferase
MLRYSLETFHALPQVRSIALVLPAERMALGLTLAKEFPKLVLAVGGAERWISVQNGFKALPMECQTVLIHDAARPFISKAIIEACLEKIEGNRAVTVAISMTDTVKEVEGSKVMRTLDRSRLIRVQTPQGFSRSLLETLYQNLVQNPPQNTPPTDEAQMAEALGFPMEWVPGNAENTKVTDAEDWVWAQRVAAIKTRGS